MKSKPRMCRNHPDARAVGLSSLCVACSVERIAKRRPKVERVTPAYAMTRAASTAPRAAVRAMPKAQPHRSRGLLDLAHEIHFCTNCEEYVAHGCEPAHANGALWGKGLSQKADDWAHAALCHRCHRWVDQPLGDERDPSGRFPATREGRREMWFIAHFKTQAIYWRNRWLIVARAMTLEELEA